MSIKLVINHIFYLLKKSQVLKRNVHKAAAYVLLLSVIFINTVLW